jgi:hypothetical protein
MAAVQTNRWVDEMAQVVMCVSLGIVIGSAGIALLNGPARAVKTSSRWHFGQKVEKVRHP